MDIANIESPPFYGATPEAQAGMAGYLAGRIVNLHCKVDGIPVPNLEAYRVPSPQISISVPTPWILGDIGGLGTLSGDGYFIFLSPLSPGEHTLQFGGTISMTWPTDLMDMHEAINITYHITVVK